MRASSLGLKEIRVHFGTFDYVIICLVGSYKNVERYVAWKFEEKEIPISETQRQYGARGRFFYRIGFAPIIWIPKRPTTPREHATLAHEMLHAIQEMMDWAAIPFTFDTGEVFCHALAHGINTVLQELAPKRKT